jgi:hypothetical protein
LRLNPVVRFRSLAHSCTGQVSRYPPLSALANYWVGRMEDLDLRDWAGLDAFVAGGGWRGFYPMKVDSLEL